MSLLAKAFVAGAAEGAAESIEKRNNEIRKNAAAELEMLRKEAEEKDEKLRTKRDELRSTAQALSSYRDGKGVALTETQITALLMQPVKAKQILKTLETEKDLGNIDFSKVLKVGAKPEDVLKPQEYIQKATSIPAGLPESQPTPVVRGAFGFESPAYKQAQQQFEQVSGKSVRDIRAKALGSPDEIPAVPLEVDLSQFKKPESIEMVQNRLADNIANGGKYSDPENQKLLERLKANTAIKEMIGEGEGGKPRTAAQINGVFDKSLRIGLEPFITGRVVRLDPETNTYVPISGDVDAVNSFMKQRNEIVQSRAREMGILDKDNNIIGGRNSEDALLPYAIIKDGKVVSWRSATTVTTPAPAPAPAPGTAAPAPSAAPAKPATATQSAEVLPLPKTKDGKLDGTKLVAGKQYRAADNSVKTWNGTGWQ
jgi:hypothetical protein